MKKRKKYLSLFLKNIVHTLLVCVVMCFLLDLENEIEISIFFILTQIPLSILVIFMAKMRNKDLKNLLSKYTMA